MENQLDSQTQKLVLSQMAACDQFSLRGTIFMSALTAQMTAWSTPRNFLGDTESGGTVGQAFNAERTCQAGDRGWQEPHPKARLVGGIRRSGDWSSWRMRSRENWACSASQNKRLKVDVPAAFKTPRGKAGKRWKQVLLRGAEIR